jgi:hypothetical protein
MRNAITSNDSRRFFCRASRVMVYSTCVAFLQASPVRAQGVGSLSTGPNASYNFNNRFQASLGGNLMFGLPAHLALYPSFNVYFPQSGSLWNLSGLVVWRRAYPMLLMYAGAGGYWSHAKSSSGSSSNEGIEAAYGVEATRGSIHPFLEFEVLTNGFSTQGTAGLRIRVLAGH